MNADFFAPQITKSNQNKARKDGVGSKSFWKVCTKPGRTFRSQLNTPWQKTIG